MRRGCIAVGNVKCDACHRVVRHGERYLTLDEEDVKCRLCVDCCVARGYTSSRLEKGKEVLSFLSVE